ncbi:MAG: cysteine--tRNA ligase [Planctomycetes bacterium]|nr:cysteine--tRNA ligase [Planctomycetota bacterium]
MAQSRAPRADAGRPPPRRRSSATSEAAPPRSRLPFQVHNTLTKSKEPFRTLQPGVVRMYNCGPTVYGRAHIGNFRAYLFADTLRRWLECSGYEVRQVMNITDVGHLLDDAEEGEDKIEAQARREKLDPWAISRRHTEQFFADLKDLGCEPAMVYPKASEHIAEMLEMIDGLVAKGYAYQVGEDVYYEVAKFPRYGKLSGNTVEELDAGSRIDVREEKRHPADFALWKSDAHHVMKWKSRYGPDGFPGWHIECSAMSRKHLGDRIDIHTGGEDNIFPHHECEIAQTESFTGQPFATYWMHSKFLKVDDGKMSKSLGNTYTLDDVAAKGFNARQLRFALIRGHSRAPLNFTWDAMQDAASSLANLDDLVSRLRRVAHGEGAAADPNAGSDFVDAARAEFEEHMNDDLNVAPALAPLSALRAHALGGEFGVDGAARALEFLARANTVLGCIRIDEELLDSKIDALIQERQAARKSKDFVRADEIRKLLDAQGIVLEDGPKGVVWRRK